MVKMWDITKINPADVVPVCPFGYTFQECNDMETCSLYAESIGCIAYDVRGRFY